MSQLARTDAAMRHDDWQMMKEQATMLVRTGFLPEAIKTPEQAVAIMLKGRELELPPMYALSNIVVIKGKPVASAELLQALVYRDHGDAAMRIKHTDAERCTIEYRRRSWSSPEVYSFTIEDAKRAGLTGNNTWQKFPQAMLRARCISAVARMAFADTIGGMFTAEELGATVDGDGAIVGEVIETPRQIAAPVNPLAQEAFELQEDLFALDDSFIGKSLGKLKTFDDTKLEAYCAALSAQIAKLQVPDIQPKPAADDNTDDLWTKEPAQVEESAVEALFWDRYGHVFNRSWTAVQKFYGALIAVPTTDDDWRKLDADVNERLNAEATKAGA